MLAQRRAAHLSENPARDHGALWHQAMRAGDFQAAWSVNDQVLAARDPRTRDDPRTPYHERWVWDGRPPDGRRVLVRCYHGLGDTIQFARYLQPLRARAAHVTLEVQPELLQLLDTLPGPDRVHPFDPAAPLPQAECDIEIMELAHALRLPPDPAPYLNIPPLPGPPGRIGLCWQAGAWDPDRSMPADALHPIAARTHPISLQRGPASRAAAQLRATDPLNGSMDLLATAGLIAGLDAVVTIDTMIAHLAGALGRPTYVLLKRDPDWRWAAQPPPWYATAQTVRQPTPGDWPGAVAQLVATFIAAKGS